MGHMCAAWSGDWLTEKTRTSELVIGTKYGVASFRVVESRNGKKIDVYSGFDPIETREDLGPAGDTMPYDPGTDLPHLANAEFWENRYASGVKKASEKWVGNYQGPDSMDVAAAVHTFVEGPLLANALSADPRIKSHFQMVSGDLARVSSAPKRSAAAAAKAAANQVKLATKEVEFKERVLVDDLWGIF